MNILSYIHYNGSSCLKSSQSEESKSDLEEYKF